MKKKKVDNYDFDLILPVEVFKENQERMLKENLKRKKKARLNSILWGLLACLVLGGIFYLGSKFQADSMAKSGSSAEDIIKHFYVGVEIKDVNEL